MEDKGNRWFLLARRKLRGYLTLKTVFLAAVVVRVFLLVYGEWQDSNFAVKFTDVDYHVFNDAALHVMEGRSPFLRPTYRYTPLLAFLLTLNHHLFFSFGKLLFVCCDLGVGLLIHQILRLRGVGRPTVVFSVSLWLLNPLTATVSSRGNAESILAVLVLLTLYLIMHKRIYLSAIFFGLAIHMKIFPVIYSLPLFLLIDSSYTESADLGRSELDVTSTLWRFLNPQRVRFVSATIATFFIITATSYLL
jgi:phosphatidylinositol glycan class M